MTSGSDSDSSDPDSNLEDEPRLSPKAREVKRKIQDGSYQLDLAGLAERLLDDGVLEDDLSDADAPSDRALKLVPDQESEES